MAKDADFDKVSLLLECDGADGSNSFIDLSPRPKAVTAVGAQINNSQLLFGKRTGRFNPGDYLTIPESTDFGFGTGAMGIEFFIWPTLTGDATQVALDLRPIDAGIPLLIGLTVGGAVRYYDGSTVRTGGALTPNAWNHVAWCRDDVGVNSIYAGGGLVSSYTAMQDFGASKGICIGANVVKYAERLSGRLAQIRIYKGRAPYTGPFTPPTGPYPRYGDLSGLVEDASGAPAARLVRAMREDTGQFVGQAISDGTTGVYTIAAGVDGPHTLNAYPASGEARPALTRRGVLPV